MDRREFVKSSVAATLAATVNIQAEARASAGKLNVLYLFSDQHRAVSLPGEADN